MEMRMQNRNTGLHLWQKPHFCATDGSWHDSFWDAIRCSRDELSWDPAALLSMLTSPFVFGDRTLVKGVSRQPWLSKITPEGSSELLDIPPHGRKYAEPDEIAAKLEELLCDEAAKVCEGHDEVYVLLSGGLDSRIGAGIVARLYREGRLAQKPRAVTWGFENCRDVVYSRKVADILGLDWIHIPLGPENLLENIDHAVTLGSLVTPPHLHCMSWFENVSPNSIVLAGSYGDSIGRAEFSGSHLLAVDYYRPVNRYGLLRKELYPKALHDMNLDLQSLRRRNSGAPKYVLCEYERQAHYMRSQIAHAMSLINNYCSVYQLFTDPEVYSYMWSIHPSLRDDRVYACLLERLDSRLARLPWARTNRALSGKTEGAVQGLSLDFHDYRAWIVNDLYNAIEECIDIEWFKSSGLFNHEGIKGLSDAIRHDYSHGASGSFRPYELWIWFASVRAFERRCRDLGKNIVLDHDDETPVEEGVSARETGRAPSLRQRIGQNAYVKQYRKKIRNYVLKKRALKEFPPQ